MQEITVNLHMHTRYSDGSGTHGEIARAALRAGLDAVIVTDHNVLVRGIEGYFGSGRRRVLILLGEEIHDQSRQPQKDHLLVLGANQELATYAENADVLIKRIREANGLAFIAHPHDPAAPTFNEPDISWTTWSARDFTGIELWNGFSELKTLLPTRLHGVFYAFFPKLVARGPLPETLSRWDHLLSERRVVAIGGSDAHALHMRMGLLRRDVFPYDFHFSAINTHVLLQDALAGDAATDVPRIYAAIAAGHCYVGYDLPSPTRGFRFTAHGHDSQATMGDAITSRGGVTLQAYVPATAEIRLIKDGRVIQTAMKTRALAHRANEAGVYRIESYRRYMGRRRGWIFSNPIYVM